jgi:predicted nucleic acid-binding protein
MAEEKPKRAKRFNMRLAAAINELEYEKINHYPAAQIESAEEYVHQVEELEKEES